jgi:uncharacterized membrane protein YbhN (UPF0104 family)
VPQHLSLAVELPEGWTAISPADFAPGGRRRIVLARWRYFVGTGGDEPTLTALTIIAPDDVADEVRAGADRGRTIEWLTRLALLVVAGLVTVVVVRLIGRIDWAAVYDALRHLTWWQPFVLLAVVVVAVAILVAVLLVVRSDQLAIRVGSFSGRMARKVRPSVDPDAWVRACVDFRVQISARFRYGFIRSLLALCGMLAADLTVLVLSLRFVGVSSSEVPLLYAAIAYLFAHPFTLFPFSGLGIVDALVLAAVVEAGGLEVEAAAVAALVVWRVFTVAVPILMGLGAVTAWRRGWLGDVPPETEAPRSP